MSKNEELEYQSRNCFGVSKPSLKRFHTGAKADMGTCFVTRNRPAGSNKNKATNRQKKRRRK